METVTNDPRINDLANRFRSIAAQMHLSKNEIEVYLHLLNNCDIDTLQTSYSLEKLSTNLYLAVNTIKACRNTLEEQSLISFVKNDNQPTTYYLRDLNKDEIVESVELENSCSFDTGEIKDDLIETENLSEENQNQENSFTLESEVQKSEDQLIETNECVIDDYKTIDDYDFSFMDVKLIPAYKTLILNRLQILKQYSQESLIKRLNDNAIESFNGESDEATAHNTIMSIKNDISRPLTQKRLKELYDAYLIVGNSATVIKNLVLMHIEANNIDAIVSAFDLSFVEKNLLVSFKKIIIKIHNQGGNVSQEELISLYTKSIIDSRGNEIEFEKCLQLNQ